LIVLEGLKVSQTAQKRALANPGRPFEDNHLAFLDMQAQIPDHAMVFVGLGQIVNFNA
jgi:hypothetical protein